MSKLRENSIFVMHEKVANDKKQRKSFAGIVKDNKLQIGVSVCGPKDQFVKKLGRIISIGRAQKNPSKTITLTSDDDVRQTFFEAVKTL